jgi:hypothetical protein
MSILTTTFGLANSSDPYNFTFTTQPGQGTVDTVVSVTLSDGTSHDFDMDSNRPIENVSFASGGGSVVGDLTLHPGTAGRLSTVTYSGTIVQGNIAQLDCDSNVIAAWVEPAIA